MARWINGKWTLSNQDKMRQVGLPAAKDFAKSGIPGLTLRGKTIGQQRSEMEARLSHPAMLDVDENTRRWNKERSTPVHSSMPTTPATAPRRSSGLPPVKTHEEVIKGAQDRIASRSLGYHSESRLKEIDAENEGDRRLIEATKQRAQIAAEIEAAARQKASNAKTAAHAAAVGLPLTPAINKRDKLAIQIQKHMNDPDIQAKLPLDPFEGFHGEHPATSALTGKLPPVPIEEQAKLHPNMPLTTEFDQKMEAQDKAARKGMSEKQKEALAKAHAAVRAKAAAKRGATTPSISHTGGSFESQHPRVPAGQPNGGEWTDKK
jgi:hypothetical protein